MGLYPIGKYPPLFTSTSVNNCYLFFTSKYQIPLVYDDHNNVENERCSFSDLNISLNYGENTTIVCPMSGLYESYPTVVEIRSVFYGNGSCSSNNGSKIAVMKRCQGRQQCYLEASADIFNDSCPGIKKHLNVTYRCQPSE